MTLHRPIQHASLALALLAATSLLAVTAATRGLLISSAHIVERAQGEALAGAIHAATRPRHSALEEDLDAIVEAQRGYGMRALALYGADGALLRSTADSGPWPAAPPAERERRVSDGRAWHMVRIPDMSRGPGHHDGPNHRHGPPRGERPPRGRPGPRSELVFIIEYEPAEAARLEAAGAVLLIAGAIAALLLVVGAALLWRAQARAARALDEQARAAHLAHVGQMSATLAHEIRTPLTALKGHAQLLEATLEPASAGHKKAGRVVAEAARLERLIEGLLAFVRSGRVAREPSSPVAVIQRAAESANLTIQLDAQAAPDLWPLDAARLEQAARNLIENAAREGAGHPVEVIITATAATLHISVGDRGPGVSPEVAARLGEPFFTTHASGTGLGLAVADTVARAHGGRLSARPRDGGGAWFELEIGA
jgi:two-component system sensor histidine kinase HydH